jgi:L-threonylcarbamoyladenylate synthase
MTPLLLNDGLAALRSGALVIIPTETVYGLAADATNPKAIAALYAAKGRPASNPLIVHVADKTAAQRWGMFSETAHKLADAFWPGPLTLVLPMTPEAKKHLAPAVTAGHDTLALRVPQHPLTLEVLRSLPFPLAAPSANLSNHLSPTRIQHLHPELLAHVAHVWDGGPCIQGLESTIVQVIGDNWALLRHGVLTQEDLTTFLKTPPHFATTAAPGQSLRHYAPQHPMILNSLVVGPQDALLAFGPHVPAGGMITQNLSITGNLNEAAARLFDALHTLDQWPCQRIVVMPIPEVGVGIAINERLRKGAARATV